MLQPSAILLVAATLLLPAAMLLAGESNIRETAETITLWTDDGLELALRRSDGHLEAVTIDDQQAVRGPAPMLRLEEVMADPPAPDLLGDGDFVDGLGAWSTPGGVVEQGPEGIGGHWLKLTGPDRPWAERTLDLSQTDAQPLVVSGRCRSKIQATASGWMNVHLAINTYGTYLDGSTMPEQSAYFGQYDHGPQTNQKILCPDRPLKSLKLMLTTPGPECAAWYSDVKVQPARYRRVSPAGECERIDHTVYQEFSLEEEALRGLVSYRPLREVIEVRCRLQTTEEVDRALSAYVAIPLQAVGGKWYDDFRTTRLIEAGKLYRSSKWYGAGRDGWDSRYPIACLEDASGAGIAIGTSVEEPRVFQIEYDASAEELRIRFDLGLSPNAGRWANRAAFTAYLFRYDIRDGFRGATEKYHRLFDWAFMNKRAVKEGLWSAFVSPAHIPGGCDEFGFQFVEAVGNIGWETRRGMTTLKYAEPWINHHESPPHAAFEETRGPVDPQGAIQRARKMGAMRDTETPPDSRHRYAGYTGSYIEDNWGQPQGYFFRNPAGRNENMMIVNPNPLLPPPDRAHLSSGDLDWENSLEALRLWKQWSVEGWALYRVGERTCLEIDTETKASGRQSARFDPIRSKGYYEQYVRGLSQTVYNDEGHTGPFEFSFAARAENLPQAGTGLSWSVELQSADDHVQNHAFPLKDLGPEWQRYTHVITTKEAPFAIRALLVNAPWFPDPTTLWIDDVRLTVPDNDENLLANGDFETAELLPGEVDGIYLDTMECYTNNLNYRREHWPYAEEPLTFDCARRPALQQQFSHVTYAKIMAERMHRRDLLLFGNCAPGTCFGAPYLDIMGGEESWERGGKWQPKPDAEFNLVRFMCRAKPFCLLQYSNLDGDDMARYIRRCVFYGVWPGNQSSSPTTGKWYWTNAVLVARDRPTYAKYMPVLHEITKAGWQPITRATSSDPEVWLERFGEGEPLFLTVFNPTDQTRTTTVSVDARAALGPQSRLAELVEGREVPWTSAGEAFSLTLDPEEVRVVRIQS